MRLRGGPVIALLLLVGCADAPASEPREEPSPAPDVARIACEADGTTTVATPDVEAQPDGVHLQVMNRLAEPASLNDFGFDVDPGVSEWILSLPPGPYPVACWPFSEHSSGEIPATLPFRVLDPEGLYVPGPELECAAWSASGDYVSPTTGVADDPIEAARRSLTGLQEGDDLAIRISGYPEADDEGGATVVVSRDGRLIAIVGAIVADDGRWFAPDGSGCVDSGLDFT